MTILSGQASSDLDDDLVPADVLRATMRQHVAGVAVITTSDGGPVGFCATSLTSVSLDPPCVSFSVAAASASGRAWRHARHGIIHLLNGEQAEVAMRFARSGPDKFSGNLAWRWGPGGAPLIDSVLAWMLVSPRHRLLVGDHMLIICDVRKTATTPAPAGPLIRHNGGFHAMPMRKTRASTRFLA